MKHFKCITVGAVFLAVVSLSSTVGLSLFADSKGQQLLSEFSKRVPGLELASKTKDNGLFTKTGRLYLRYAPHSSSLKPNAGLLMAFDYRINLGFLGVSGSFDRVRGFGNLDEWARPLIKELPRIHGGFRGSLFELGASAQVQSEEFFLPFDDGKCTIKPMKASLSMDATRSALARLTLSELDCGASRNYQGRKAYALNARDIYFDISPKLSGKTIQKAELKVGAKDISAEASTLYLIGFEPNDQVKDPSLRDGVSFKEPNLSVTLDSPDPKGLQALKFKFGGDYALGMPFIRENTMLPMRSFKKVDVEASLSSINLKALIKLLSSGDLSDFKKLGTLLSERAVFNLDRFSFEKEGEQFYSEGEASVYVDRSGTFKYLDADLAVKAGERMVRAFCENGYTESLEALIKDGSITLRNGEFSTKIQLQGNSLKFNGKSLGAVEDEDDPDAISLEKNITIEDQDSEKPL